MSGILLQHVHTSDAPIAKTQINLYIKLCQCSNEKLCIKLFLVLSHMSHIVTLQTTTSTVQCM